MWKFVFAGCLLLYDRADPLPRRVKLQRFFCKINSDCSKDECCVSFDQRLLPSGLRQFAKGKCEKLGISCSVCYDRYYIIPPDIYYDACPCSVGFTCVGTGNVEVPQSDKGTCQQYSLDE